MLLQLPETYCQLFQHMNPTYFDDLLHRRIVDAYINARNMSSEQPTQISVAQQLFNGYDNLDKLPEDAQDLMNEFTALYNIPVENVKYTLEQVRTWARDHAMVQAIEASASLVCDS